MKTNMQETSLTAYHTQTIKLGKSQQRVLNYITEASRQGIVVTDMEIERALHMRISSVTGRRNDLVKLGLVVKARKVWNPESELWNWAWRAKL